jgi:hypothetical protein
MSSAWFIWAVLLLQAVGGGYCVIERNHVAALLMAAGVLAQVAALMSRGPAV